MGVIPAMVGNFEESGRVRSLPPRIPPLITTSNARLIQDRSRDWAGDDKGRSVGRPSGSLCMANKYRVEAVKRPVTRKAEVDKVVITAIVKRNHGYAPAPDLWVRFRIGERLGHSPRGNDVEIELVKNVEICRQRYVIIGRVLVPGRM